MEITITCDRCGKVVHGLQEETWTSGFYDVTKGAWNEFARWEEERICDACMFSDPKYKKMYSINSNISASFNITCGLASYAMTCSRA